MTSDRTSQRALVASFSRENRLDARVVGLELLGERRRVGDLGRLGGRRGRVRLGRASGRRLRACRHRVSHSSAAGTERERTHGGLGLVGAQLLEVEFLDEVCETGNAARTARGGRRRGECGGWFGAVQRVGLGRAEEGSGRGRRGTSTISSGGPRRAREGSDGERAGQGSCTATHDEPSGCRERRLTLASDRGRREGAGERAGLQDDEATVSGVRGRLHRGRDKGRTAWRARRANMA